MSLDRFEIGLKTKTLWYGKKRDATKNSQFKQTIQAVHLECEGKYTSITAKVIKMTLASPFFQQRHKCDARLIPN